ncbi:LysR substrate-binding domain-containing protein [Streptomonospora nanhaiensis]|uniref:LysR substrate-binding domain-containing protein n=1 Tax=Streptomonospora nanhaiensis TaxID=1323731 RepID=UPI0027E38B66|nr:LysR substrate-binding domain-containing protein [Streptomonospora nanhaiensis]
MRLLHRTSRTVEPTAAGARVLTRARPLLAGADELVAEAASGRSRLNIGHAWSAFGRHTTEFQRRWRRDHPDVELRLVRHNSSTGGLAEGLCDLAVVRSALDLKPWSHAFVGHEDRYLALASDDPWARRRGIRLAEVATRTLALDRRTGTPP